jgi:hypothetical protein
MEYRGDGGGAATTGMQSIFDSMNSFAMTAAQGGIEVSAQGGKALLDAINAFQDWVDGQSVFIDMLGQQRKLGTSNGAKVMAPFVQQVATDGEGFATQLRALQLSLNKAKEGIETAMRNYQQTEQGNQNKAKGIGV